MTAQQSSNWVREQYQKVAQFLAEKGVIIDAVILEQSRVMEPVLTVWKVKATDGKQYWAIGGDLPSDVAPVSVAADARAVLKHFSLHWQLKAENLLKLENPDPTQQDFAKLLIGRAEGLYAMAEQDDLWKTS